MYRKPDSSVTHFFDFYNDIVRKLTSEHRNIYITGDFNIDLFKDENYVNEFLSINSLFGILPVIRTATRITLNSATLTLTVLGGGGPGRPPLDIFRDRAATARNFKLSFQDFFPSSLTHMLIPFSSKSDIPVRCYITISMRMSSKKCYTCIYIHVQAEM